MSLYSKTFGKVLATPFVYSKIRPFLLGGIDYTPIYGAIDWQNDDVILDVGCGTGDGLKYIPRFKKYLGLDVDPQALEFARGRYKDPRIAFDCRMLEKRDGPDLSPSVVLLGGLLHHISDEDCLSVFRLIAASSQLRCVLSYDAVFLPGEWISNTLARLDRGRFSRTPEHYKRLVEQAGLKIDREAVYPYNPSGWGIGKYFAMFLSK